MQKGGADFLGDSGMPFPRKVVGLHFLSQIRLPHIQIPIIACFREVVWEKRALISVSASVSGMPLKLCNIHPADFS